MDPTPVEVVEASRSWADFLLSDGTRLRVHVVIHGVQRLEGEYDGYENPKYRINSQTVFFVVSPDELRKPKTVKVLGGTDG